MPITDCRRPRLDGGQGGPNLGTPTDFGGPPFSRIRGPAPKPDPSWPAGRLANCPRKPRRCWSPHDPHGRHRGPGQVPHPRPPTTTPRGPPPIGARSWPKARRRAPPAPLPTGQGSCAAPPDDRNGSRSPTSQGRMQSATGAALAACLERIRIKRAPLTVRMGALGRRIHYDPVAFRDSPIGLRAKWMKACPSG